MIFFVAMPFMTGLMNLVVPLQIGARDVAFPFLNNSLRFWMTVGGAVLVMVSLFVGEFARTGWLAYPPLSGLAYSPGVGVDYYIWALQISGVGTMLTGINLIVTIFKMRAPGMTLMQMPVFTWTALVTNILIVAAFPVLTAALALLSLDRYLRHALLHQRPRRQRHDVRQPDLDLGPPRGVHPDPAGLRHLLRSHRDLLRQAPVRLHVDGLRQRCVIAILSFLVWLHHFFTMGSGASVNAFFGITTMIISIPTGVKIFNWLFTMYRGRLRFERADAVDPGLHGHLHHRRHDRRAAGRPGRRLRAAQQPVPDRPLPQRDHRRRGVRLAGRHHLLVPEGLRLQAERVLGQACRSGAGWSASTWPSCRSTCWA